MRIFLLFFLLLAGCYQKKSAHLNPGSYIDTIFLGYRFSMDQEAFQHHTEMLLDSGILKVQDGVIVYPFAEYQVTFSASYGSSGNMQELGISLAGGHPAIMQVFLYGIFSEKYWNPEGWKEDAGYLEGSKTLTYTEGNMQVKILEGLHDARLFYRNLQDSVVPNVSHSPF